MKIRKKKCQIIKTYYIIIITIFFSRIPCLAFDLHAPYSWTYDLQGVLQKLMETFSAQEKLEKLKLESESMLVS